MPTENIPIIVVTHTTTIPIAMMISTKLKFCFFIIVSIIGYFACKALKINWDCNSGVFVVFECDFVAGSD